jgi:hypothetical protein
MKNEPPEALPSSQVMGKLLAAASPILRDHDRFLRDMDGGKRQPKLEKPGRVGMQRAKK